MIKAYINGVDAVAYGEGGASNERKAKKRKKRGHEDLEKGGCVASSTPLPFYTPLMRRLVRHYED